MTETPRSSEPQARYIAVQGVAYELVEGCQRTFTKPLLTTEALEITQRLIKGSGDAEGDAACTRDRAAYVLAGCAVVKCPEPTEVGKGHLVVVPAGVPLGQQLSLVSDELVLLEIIHSRGHATTSAGPAAPIRVVDPEQVTPYAPAGHAKTRNRCLFVDEHMEIIEGKIERGGGADRHFHQDNEQLLYVLGGTEFPLLIHYPKGAPHGTGGGIAEPLSLLVIYSPPLGESHNALA